MTKTDFFFFTYTILSERSKLSNLVIFTFFSLNWETWEQNNSFNFNNEKWDKILLHDSCGEVVVVEEEGEKSQTWLKFDKNEIFEGKKTELTSVYNFAFDGKSKSVKIQWILGKKNVNLLTILLQFRWQSYKTYLVLASFLDLIR